MSTVLAMSEQTRTGLGAVSLAAGFAFLVGLLALGAVHRLAVRNTAAASRLAPVAVVAIVAVGVIVSAQAMVLGSAQVVTMAAVLLVTATIAVAFGLTLARQVRRAELQHTAAQAQRQRDAAVEEQRQRLVSWLSHDLRTPLARMKAITEALNDGVAPDPGRYLRQLDTEVDALAELVDDLLALSRLSSREAPARRERIDLGDVLSDALASAAPTARSLGVALGGSADPGCTVAAETRDIHRALANLLDNALRHTPRGGSVSARVRARGQRAVLEVSDGCGGIDPDRIDRVFDAGWRGDDARTPGSGSGAGLGLAIVQHVVLRHGGTVSVRNQGPGCVFTVTLPLTSRTATSAAEAER